MFNEEFILIHLHLCRRMRREMNQVQMRGKEESKHYNVDTYSSFYRSLTLSPFYLSLTSDVSEQEDDAISRLRDFTPTVRNIVTLLFLMKMAKSRVLSL